MTSPLIQPRPLDLIVANAIQGMVDVAMATRAISQQAFHASLADSRLGEALARDLMCRIAVEGDWRLVRAALAAAGAPPQEEIVQRLRAVIDQRNSQTSEAV
jgi:hypothetical protein